MSEVQAGTSAGSTGNVATKGKKARSKGKQPKTEKGTRRPRALSAKKVTEKLKKAGVEDVDKVCGCVKAGIARRFIELETAADLDKVIVTGTCSQDLSTDCPHRLDTTLKMLLYQKDSGVDEYYEMDGYAVRCGKCNEGYYVSGLCAGEPRITYPKSYNHCTQCPVFGKCIGDVRNVHCDNCGKHYFAGSSGNFSCGCEERRGGKNEDCSVV